MQPEVYMSNAAIPLSDLQIFDGFKRMFPKTRTVRSTLLKTGVLHHNHFIIKKVSDVKYVGIVSGNKKFTFEMINRKRKGHVLINIPLDNVTSPEIRELIEKLIAKEDKSRSAFEEQEKENEKREALGKDPVGFHLQPPLGFSVRSNSQVSPKYRITAAQSTKNFKTAVKCGYFHKKFETFASKNNLFCMFKSA